MEYLKIGAIDWENKDEHSIAYYGKRIVWEELAFIIIIINIFGIYFLIICRRNRKYLSIRIISENQRSFRTHFLHKLHNTFRTN